MCEVWVAVIRIGQPTQQFRFQVHVIASNTAVTGVPGCGAYRMADLDGHSGRRCGVVWRQRGIPPSKACHSPTATQHPTTCFTSFSTSTLVVQGTHAACPR